MDIIKKLLLREETGIAQKNFIWNMVSSLLNSGISAVLFWLVTRINGLNDAGVFSIAFSLAQMMLQIGSYGMRNYHATDIKQKYSFSQYYSSRIITIIIMMAVSIVYSLLIGYNGDKFWIVILLCLIKATDALEDVFDGHFQLMDRLYVGGKIWTFRVVIYTIVFLLSLMFTGNLLFTCLVTFIAASLVLFICIWPLRSEFNIGNPSKDFIKVFKLLIESFPLCAGSFMLVYISYAPKNAIDMYLTSEAQAYFNYLFMPCFIINVFVGLILRLTLVKLSTTWNSGSNRKFVRLCITLILMAMAVIAMIMIGGYFLGTQMLSWFYGQDLNSYRIELLITLAGGGAYTIASILQVVLTVMRHQYAALIAFGASCLAGFFASRFLVKQYEILGAAYSYLIATAVLMFGLAITVIVYYIKSAWRLKNAKAIR